MPKYFMKYVVFFLWISYIYAAKIFLWLFAAEDFSRLFNPVRLFENKTCTWKCGHGCQVWKRPITGDWISEITWKYTYSNISNFFIPDTTSLLKFVFPIAYYFCLGGRLGGCVVVAVVAVVSIYYLFLLIILFSCLFIYLFHLFIHLIIYFYLYIYLFIYLHIYLFVYLLIYWFICLFIYLFCGLNHYSCFCCWCCHRCCCFCCWCQRCVLS